MPIIIHIRRCRWLIFASWFFFVIEGYQDIDTSANISGANFHELPRYLNLKKQNNLTLVISLSKIISHILRLFYWNVLVNNENSHYICTF